MITMGIDIGSTTSKCVLAEDGEKILASALLVGGIGTDSPAHAVGAALASAGVDIGAVEYTVATGYGRARYDAADETASELVCHAAGAHLVFPGVRTVIDIGGQDAKIISLSEAGKMRDFLMNDKCAAGTGRFLDVMATVLQIPTDELGAYAARAETPAEISSTCTVFAESEVISQLANGATKEALVAGICECVARRTAALAKRSALADEICMSGGVARNEGVRRALEAALSRRILYSPMAQLFGALGAAHLAYTKAQRAKAL